MWLRALRQEMAWSRETLAKLANVSPATIGMIESGYRTPSIAVVEQLAGAFGLRPSELVAEMYGEPKS